MREGCGGVRALCSGEADERLELVAGLLEMELQVGQLEVEGDPGGELGGHFGLLVVEEGEVDAGGGDEERVEEGQI